MTLAQIEERVAALEETLEGRVVALEKAIEELQIQRTPLSPKGEAIIGAEGPRENDDEIIPGAEYPF
ncbi:MAG: hypothetical protein ACRELF_12055, partial [Gemmataceae bacterium]